MSLSGLNINIGILEAGVPDIFAGSLSSLSTWDSSYYTLSGANVTDMGNPGQFTSWPTFGMTSADLVTDGDGTNWFTDPLDAIVGAETNDLSTGNGEALRDNTNGVITLESYRVKNNQSNSVSALEDTGFDMLFNAGAATFWRNLYWTSSSVPHSDYEHYRQVPPGIMAAPYDTEETQYRFGPMKDDSAYPGTGVYDPDGNSFTSGYVAGDDIVMSWFYQSSGIRLMVNGTFVTLYCSEFRDNAQVVLSGPDAALETALWSEDFRPYQMAANGGYGAQQFQMRPNLGAQTKTDYMGIFDGAKTDGWIASAHSYLLNNKP